MTTTTEGANTNTDTATVTTEERGHKRSADEADLEKHEVYQRPKIVERPYGRWTTVAVRYVSFMATETQILLIDVHGRLVMAWEGRLAVLCRSLEVTSWEQY